MKHYEVNVFRVEICYLIISEIWKQPQDVSECENIEKICGLVNSTKG